MDIFDEKLSPLSQLKNPSLSLVEQELDFLMVIGEEDVADCGGNI